MKNENKNKLKCALGVCTPKILQIEPFLKINVCEVCGKVLEKGWWVRLNVAENINTPTDVLRELAKDESWYVRCQVAINKNTPAEVLRELAKDKIWEVKWNVAENINTPVEVLKELANDEDGSVRWRVVENINTPVDVLRELSKDENWEVRCTVAENKNTPVEVLRELAKDENVGVRMGALKRIKKKKMKSNKNKLKCALGVCTPKTLQIAQNWKIKICEVCGKVLEDYHVREAIACYKNTPVEVLRELAKDENAGVREEVTYNNNTPVEVLRELANDKDWEVRCGVIHNANTPVDVLRELENEFYIKKEPENGKIQFNVIVSPKNKRSKTDEGKRYSNICSLFAVQRSSGGKESIQRANRPLQRTYSRVRKRTGNNQRT